MKKLKKSDNLWIPRRVIKTEVETFWVWVAEVECHHILRFGDQSLKWEFLESQPRLTFLHRNQSNALTTTTEHTPLFCNVFCNVSLQKTKQKLSNQDQYQILRAWKRTRLISKRDQALVLKSLTWPDQRNYILVWIKIVTLTENRYVCISAPRGGALPFIPSLSSYQILFYHY